MLWFVAGFLLVVLVLLHAVAYARARNMTVFLPHDGEPGSLSPSPSLPRRAAHACLRLLGGPIRSKPAIQTTPTACGLPWQTCSIFSRGHRLEAWLIPASLPRAPSDTEATATSGALAECGDARASLGRGDTSTSLASGHASVSAPDFAYPAAPSGSGFPVPGESISASVSKRGMVLVFPGLGCTKDHYLPHAAILHDLGWDTLLVDFPGHGGSTGLRTSLGYHEAGDVAHVVADVRERFAPARMVLAGVSLGAVAILRAVRVHSLQPDGLILEAPFNSLAQTIHNRIRAMGVPSPVLAELLLLWGGMLHGYLPVRLVPERDAEAVHSPTLFLHAVPDQWVTEAEARRVHDRVGGREKRFVGFADAGHGECLASDPEQWRREVGAFLAGLA